MGAAIKGNTGPREEYGTWVLLLREIRDPGAANRTNTGHRHCYEGNRGHRGLLGGGIWGQNSTDTQLWGGSEGP